MTKKKNRSRLLRAFRRAGFSHGLAVRLARAAAMAGVDSTTGMAVVEALTSGALPAALMDECGGEGYRRGVRPRSTNADGEDRWTVEIRFPNGGKEVYTMDY